MVSLLLEVANMILKDSLLLCLLAREEKLVALTSALRRLMATESPISKGYGEYKLLIRALDNFDLADIELKQARSI